LWPLEAETLAIVLTGWEGFGAIRTTQQIAAAALQAALDTANARISQLERENQALRDQLYG
jgi:cell division protein FtsB